MMRFESPVIKPCPFCGSKEIKGYNKDLDKKIESYIQCFNKDCWAQLKARPYKKAIERWNRREAEMNSTVVKNG